MRNALLAGTAVVAAAVSGTAAADELRVVASIKPIHALVAGVMAGVGTPTLLVEGAGSPHTYSLRPSKAAALEDADVVFWVGEDLEAFMVKPLEALSADARVVELSATAGLTLLETREGGVWDGHAHEGEHAEEAHAEHPDDAHAEHAGDDQAEHAGDDNAEHAGEDHAEHAGEEHAEHAGEEHGAHAHGAFDMHVWLDPRNARVMVERIAAVLSEADPAHADAFGANAAAYEARLAELDRAIAERLAPVGDRPFVVFHDAYQYFEHRYDLNAAGSITLSPERRPGARRLGEIRDRLAELEATCVFAEPQFEPSLVRTVVEGTGAGTGTLDPLGADLEAGRGHYIALMNNLAASLLDCFEAATAD